MKNKIIITILLVLVMFSSINAGQKQKWNIIAPSPCYLLKEVKENNVYIIKDEKCKNPNSLFEVEVDSNYKELNIYADGKLIKKQTQNDVKISDIIKVNEKAKEIEKEIKQSSLENKHTSSAEKWAESVYNYYQSEEFQKNYRKYKEQIENMLLQGQDFSSNDFVNPYKDMKSLKAIELNPDERIYILISSSMPENTIKNYIKQSLNFSSNVYFVLRGGIKGLSKVQPTVNWLYNMIKVNPLCEKENCEVYPVRILIDPFIYRKFNIDKVPAVIYVRGLPDISIVKESEGKLKHTFSAISLGDISIEYHLKIMSEKTKDDRLNKIYSLYQENLNQKAEIVTPKNTYLKGGKQ
ncbi:MAG: TrbC family F-type conjugative pilus assembly protein [Candidatus Micrarchaeia archaeon]